MNAAFYKRARHLAREADSLIRLRVASDWPGALAHLAKIVGTDDKPALELLRNKLLAAQTQPTTAAATGSNPQPVCNSVNDILRLTQRPRRS